MLDKSAALKYYSREDVQTAIVAHADNKEIAVRFYDFFGKRPDVLKYPGDVLELAKQGASSFHSSEELWRNPLHISSTMKKKDVEELRIGWDIVLDIDCPYWNLAKITTWLLIMSLKELGINSVSLKFSGNKGFHIGVGFDVFPKIIGEVETKTAFPEAARNIALFLLDYIKNTHIKVTEDGNIIFGNKFKIGFQKLMDSTDKDIDELTEKYCSDCNKVVKGSVEESNAEFVCSKCDSRVTSKDEYVKCQKCGIFMEKFEHKKSLCKCGSNSFYRKFNPLSIIEVDTILISSRHLYRMPYSLHEKSGLASIPINPDKVLNFDKKLAKPENVITTNNFIERNGEIEANELFEKAYTLAAKNEVKEEDNKKQNFEALQEAVPEALFPPCIKKVLAGLEDGRKRALFILVNFLASAGWDYDAIEKRLREWNKNNGEELRETYLVGQIRYHKQQKKQILPPNCANQMYYKDLRICDPDNLCKSIKNPVNYSIRKVRFGEKIKKKPKKEEKT